MNMFNSELIAIFSQKKLSQNYWEKYEKIEKIWKVMINNKLILIMNLFNTIENDFKVFFFTTFSP